MKAPLAIEIIFYGIILSLFSAFVHRVAQEVPAHFRNAGMIAGAVVFVCGVVALIGFGRHFWALLTQIAISIFLLAELVITWRRSTLSHPLGIIFLAIMLTFSLQLIRMLARPAPVEPNPFDPRSLNDQRD